MPEDIQAGPGAPEAPAPESPENPAAPTTETIQPADGANPAPDSAAPETATAPEGAAAPTLSTPAAPTATDIDTTALLQDFRQLLATDPQRLGIAPGQPGQPQRPGAAPSTQQPSGTDAAPGAGLDALFSDEDQKALGEALGDDAVKRIDKRITGYITAQLKKATEPLQKIIGPLDQVFADYSERKATENRQLETTLTGFFDKLSEKGMESAFGHTGKTTTVQWQARAAIVTEASRIREYSMTRGVERSWPEALAMAHSLMGSAFQPSAPQAVKTVQTQVQNRNKQITVPPSTRGSVKGGATEENPREEAKALWRQARAGTK